MRIRKFSRENSLVINILGHGEARARLQFPALDFPGGIPDDRPAISAAAAKGRPGNGQLCRQVAGWLAARPRLAHSREIAKDLGRSAGNALATLATLATLAGRAEAARIVGKPLRYEANPATAAAAITPKAPASPKAAPAAPPAAPKPAASSAPPAGPKAAAPSAAPGPVTAVARAVTASARTA